MKKFIVFCLTAVMMLVAVGCGADDAGIDKTKTQLYVSNYNGGYGTEWLKQVKDRFETEYAGTSFEAGKTGVQIIIHADKDGYYGKGLFDRMSTTSDEVFFSEGITFNDYVSKGYMLDISDVVTGENSDGKTIESKMSVEQKSALQIGDKYYCVPHYAAFTGINYDIDLFNNKSLYYAKDGAPSEAGYTGVVEYTDLEGDRSAGPDGEYGTYDDGLPATYGEFFALCGYMKNTLGITPFCWTGQYHATYSRWILAALAADYEGKEQMRLNYDFNGTAKNLVRVSGSNIVPDANPTTIQNSNGYEMYRSAGRYYALKFFENILDNRYYESTSMGNSSSAISAQSTYLRSRSENKSIAMLLEGIWWENEATPTFNEMAEVISEDWAMSNRRFGMMPLPKVSADKIGEKPTLLDNNDSYAFIRKNIDSSKVELAKLFLKYCNTDASLQEFTTVVGLPKALNYDMGSNVTWKSTYSKNVWDLYKSADKVYPISQNPLYLSSQSTFVYYTTFNTDTETSAIDALYNGHSAEEHFAGIISSSTRSQEYWNKHYQEYWNKNYSA